MFLTGVHIAARLAISGKGGVKLNNKLEIEQITECESIGDVNQALANGWILLHSTAGRTSDGFIWTHFILGKVAESESVMSKL